MPKRAVKAELQPCIRWTVLILVSLSSFAYYYSYDIPVSLQKQFLEYYDLNGVTYCLIYSISAYPNAILPFFNGAIANYVGFNRSILVSFGVIVLGHIAIYCSLLLTNIHNAYLLLLSGRLMYGIGSESFLMLITPTIYKYFKDKELSLSLSLYFTISRIGTASILMTSYYFKNNPQSNQQDMISFLVLIGLYIYCACFLFLIVLITYRIRSKQHVLRAHTMASITSADVWNPSGSGLEKDINAKAKLLADTHRQFTYETSRSEHDIKESEVDLTSLLFSDNLQTTTVATTLTYITSMARDNILNTGFNWNDIKLLNMRYWFLILNCCLITATILPFINIGSSYLQNMYDIKQFDCNLLLMIPILICCIFTPIFSIIIEKYGGRCQWLLLSSIMLSISHYILGFIEIGQSASYYPIIALLGIGVAYSCFSSVIWSSFALVVELKLLPTAYCIQTCIYNMVIPTTYIIVGILVTNDNYQNVNRFLLLLSLFSIITVCFLWYLDEKFLRNHNANKKHPYSYNHNHNHNSNGCASRAPTPDTDTLLMTAYDDTNSPSSLLSKDF